MPAPSADVAPRPLVGPSVSGRCRTKVSVIAEIFGVTTVIGYIMNYSREILATQMVFAWAIVMILIMMAMDKVVFDGVARHFGRWR